MFYRVSCAEHLPVLGKKVHICALKKYQGASTMTQALTNPGTLGQFVKGTSIKLRRQLGADVVYPYMKVREVDI